MVDPLTEAVQETFKDAMKESGAKQETEGASLLELADDLEKRCAGHPPFTIKVMVRIAEQLRQQVPPEREKDIKGPATVLFEPTCHPGAATLCIYRSGYLYLACRSCFEPVGHMAIAAE